MPISATDVILTHGILNQVNVLKYFDCAAFWDDNYLAELTENVTIVYLANCGVIYFFLVEFKKLVSFAGYECFTIGRLNCGCHF